MKRAFIPEPDITAYELAEIISWIAPNSGLPPRAGIDFTDDAWQEFPDGIKRHFKEMAPYQGWVREGWILTPPADIARHHGGDK